jgi:hypothetical protein
MKTFFNAVMIVAVIYFGIHLTFWAIVKHQELLDRQGRPPIELRR